eukprot:g79962.t1
MTSIQETQSMKSVNGIAPSMAGKIKCCNAACMARKKKRMQCWIALVVAICFIIAISARWDWVFFKLSRTCTACMGYLSISVAGIIHGTIASVIKDNTDDSSFGLLGMDFAATGNLKAVRAFTILGLMGALITMPVCYKVQNKLVHTVAFAVTCLFGVIAMSVFVDQVYVGESSLYVEGYGAGFTSNIIGWTLAGARAVISFFVPTAVTEAQPVVGSVNTQPVVGSVNTQPVVGSVNMAAPEATVANPEPSSAASA